MDKLDQQVEEAADYFKMIDFAYQQALGQGDTITIGKAITAWEAAYTEYNTLKRKQFNRDQRRRKISVDQLKGKPMSTPSPELPGRR